MIRRARWPAIALVGLLAVAGGLYGSLRALGNRPASGCEASASLLPVIAPLARGEVAAFRVEAKAEPARALAFKMPDGAETSLGKFRGRTVLLNLWATWCEPCKREMPALDRVQARFGSDRFEVAAINLDTRNLDAPRRWLAENAITRLAYYSDPQAKVFQDLRRAGVTEGLPTTLLVGRDGCSLGRLAGWAEWDSPDGVKLIEAALR